MALQGSTIITINNDGIILSVDKNCCKLFGYDFEELVGNKLNVIIPAPYKEQHDTYLHNYSTTKVPKIIGKSRMVEAQSKDGSIFPIRLSVSKVGEGPDTVFIGMIDKLEDKSASITIDASGTIISCNQAVEELFGYRPAELIGNNVTIIMSSPHKERHNSYINNYRKGGVPKVIGQVRNVPARHKNGNMFPISLQVEHVKMGNIELFRGKLEKVDMMEAVFSIDDEGTIVSCNHNFVLPLFGYTTSELIGKNISILIPEIHQSTAEDTTTSQPGKRQKLDDRGNAATTATASNGSDSSYSSSTSSSSGAWKATGVHRKELRHKDGSLFPVNLEIQPFQTTDGKYLFSGRIKRADLSADDQSTDDPNFKYIGEYCLARTVGQGTYGKVKLAHHKQTRQEVAIKVLQKSRMKPIEIERVKREIEIMRKLDHPNIAKLIDVIDSPESVNIVMENAGTTLLAYVMERGGLQEPEAHKFFCQMLSAVEYCHRSNIIHRFDHFP
jgi:PAS domain S-box-containing protein